MFPLTHSCLHMLIMKIHCPEENLSLMGLEHPSTTGLLLNNITTWTSLQVARDCCSSIYITLLVQVNLMMS